MALILIVFEGGSWHGRSTKIDAGAHEQNGRAERWAKTEDETHVYQKTTRVKEVEVEHDTRQGKRHTIEEAAVYELVERKPAFGSTAAQKSKKPKKAVAQPTLF